MNNWKIYWYYAEIVLQMGLVNESDSTPRDLSPEQAEKMLNLFYKSFRILYNSPNWDVAYETCDEMLTASIELLTSEIINILFKSNNF